MPDLHVAPATVTDAPALVEVVHAAFRARPVLDPPSTALTETPATVAKALEAHGGLLARVDGAPAGAMLFATLSAGGGTWLGLRRVSVHPQFRRRGVATAMVGCAEEVAATRGLAGVRLLARIELPETVEFWHRRAYVEVDRSGPELVLAKALPVELDVPTADDMRALGARLAQLLRACDLVLLSGELGAGKTTLTQGLGVGLGVRGPITSPTFIIARVHRSLGAGPPLVHVDAYRLGGVAELDDLDLDTEVAEAVTVVEWGGGIAEGLAEDRLEVVLSRSVGGAGASADSRHVRVIPVGRRWTTAALRRLGPDPEDPPHDGSSGTDQT